MAIYRTAMGKVVDMNALAAKNEMVRAVGNMKVNARGDVIDEKGRVIKPMTERVNEHYGKTVGNKSAQRQPVKQNIQADKQQPKASVSAPVPKLEELELTEAEKELEESFEDDLEVEEIKAKETGKKNGK